MLRIPTALIGVNLTENENIFIGAIVKINEVNDVLLLVDNAEVFTDQVNDVIKSIEKLYKTSKTSSDFFEMVRYIPSARLMFYDKLVPIHNEAAGAEMILTEVKRLYMNVFTNIKTVDKRIDKDEAAHQVKVEKASAKKQSKVKADNK